jgi:coatomer subunit beta
LGHLDTDIFKDSLKSYKGNLKLESDGYKTSEGTEDYLISQPDDLIIIKQLKGREGLGELDFGDDESFKNKMMSQDEENFSVKLGKIQQLSGIGDPIYCECVVNVHHYDISLDFLVLNRSEHTAQNLTLELASEGDLKLVDRPQTVNLAAGKSERLKASVKVSSTEAGLIFGNLTYEYMREGTKIIPLNELYIDSLQYLHPATCTDVEFRTMWSKFKADEKVNITAQGNLRKFVSELAKRSNVKCLTPDAILNCSKDFLVANFYARTHFGEDALLNVSIESTPTGILGCLRVRGETIGMVRSLSGKMRDLISTLSKVVIE